MKLNEYLSTRGNAAKLAKEIGAFVSDISDWKHGHRPVPVSRCLAIEKATDGQVTVKDLRPDDWHLYWG